MSEQFLVGDTDPALEPVAVAPMIVFLASDAAAAITGEVFRVARNEISVVRPTFGPAARATGAQWTAGEIAARISEICGGTAAS